MKQIDKLITITITIITIFLSAFFFVNEKKNFSENENRYLATFPKYSLDSLKTGRYTEGIKDYLTDHFPCRDLMMSFKTTTYKLLGIKEINDVYLGNDGYLIEKFKTVTNMDKIVNVINKFQEKVGFKVQVMLIPTSVSINKDKLPKYAINDDQIEAIESFYQKLNTATIDVSSSLIANKNNYQLYYKLDHHWTSYGAYIAYLAYIDKQNLEPITDYHIELATDKFYGTLYSKTNDYTLNPDKIHTFHLDNSSYEVKYDNGRVTKTLYEESYLSKKDKYSYFLDNNHSLIEITNTNINNDNNILLIKDSYANSFVPFIVNHYKKVYVIDLRYYKASISDFIKDNGITNVLFLYNMNTINNDLGIISVH